MELLTYVVVQYVVIGLVFMWFYVILSRRPTLRGVLFEFFCWPHRVWAGAKVVWTNMGRMDL